MYKNADDFSDVTLLDYYAAAALAGIMTTEKFCCDPPDVVAKICLDRAQAMLKLREQYLKKN